jgi:hypothetical protein
MNTNPNVLAEMETGLETAEASIPMLQGILMMIPGANVIAPFLSLIPVAIEAVQAIEKATGASQTGALTALRSHMTAGMPNSPALSAGGGIAQTSQLGSG